MLWFKRIIPLVSSISTVVLISFFWDKITLPYENTTEIVGEYSKNNHHQFNDTLRFICFLFFPLLVFSTTYILTNQNKIKSFNNIFYENELPAFINQKNYEKKFYFLFFCIILFVNFLSLNLPDHKLDIFHEGQLLSGALNYNLKDKLWTGSYINTGLFYDILNTKFSWVFFGKESIGAYRLFSFTFNYIYLFFVIILIYQISKIFNFSKKKESLFFILLGIFCFYFYNIKSYNFPNYRDLFTIFFLICLSNVLILNRLKNLNYFLIGSFSITSLLWSLDRGVFLNAAIILLVIILLFKKQFSSIFVICLSIFLFWILFIFVVGIDEFNSFVFNSTNMLKYNEIWNGIIHPQPFSDDKNSTRASKALILFVINGIFIFKYLIKKNNKLNLNTILFLGLFFIIGIFYYKVGISRSDGGHIVIGSSINYMLFVILIIYEVLNFNYNKFKIKLNLNINFLIPIFLLFLILISLNHKNKHSFENFISFNKRIKDFVSKESNYFLKKDYLNFIDQLKTLTKNDNCIQNFNYDPTMYYLLGKKSCTQYYLTLNMATKNDQEKFIDQINDVNYLVVDNDKYADKFSAYSRFPIIKNHLEKYFKILTTINKYDILIKRN